MPVSIGHFIYSFIHLLIVCLIRLCGGWTRGSVCPPGAEGPVWEISYGFRTVVCVVTEAWLCLEGRWGQGEVMEDSRTEAEINLLQVDKYRRKVFQAENWHVGWMQWVGGAGQETEGRKGSDTKLEKETTHRDQQALGTRLRGWDFIWQLILEPWNNNKILVDKIRPFLFEKIVFSGCEASEIWNISYNFLGIRH